MQSREIWATWKRMRDKVADESLANDGFLTEKTETTIANGVVRLGVSLKGYPALLIPTSPQEKLELGQKTAIIAITRCDLVLHGRLSRFINITCEEPQLLEVFARFASEILHRLELGHGTDGAIDAAVREFRRLLRVPNHQAPSLSVAAGLVGELLVLVDCLKKSNRAWLGWQGPDADRHDFRAGHMSIEVKTSLGADRQSVHIHGIRQLATEGERTLVLRHIRLEPDPAGKLSVPSLVDHAARLASDPEALAGKMIELGFDDRTTEGWAVHTFRLFDSTAYLVQEGFPRVVPEFLNIPWPITGISQISYILDLAAAREFSLLPEQWEESIEEFCSCL